MQSEAKTCTHRVRRWGSSFARVWVLFMVCGAAVACATAERIPRADGGAYDAVSGGRDVVLEPSYYLDATVVVRPQRDDATLPDAMLPDAQPRAEAGLDAMADASVDGLDQSIDSAIEMDSDVVDAVAVQDAQPSPIDMRPSDANGPVLEPYTGLTEVLLVEIQPPNSDRWFPYFHLVCPYDPVNVGPWGAYGLEEQRHCRMRWYGLAVDMPDQNHDVARYESGVLAEIWNQIGLQAPLVMGRIENSPSAWQSVRGRGCTAMDGEQQCSLSVVQEGAGTQTAATLVLGLQVLGWQVVDPSIVERNAHSLFLLVSMREQQGRVLRQQDGGDTELLCLVPVRNANGSSSVQSQVRFGVVGARVRFFSAAAVEDATWCRSQHRDPERWGDGRVLPAVEAEQEWRIRISYTDPEPLDVP